MAKIMLANDDEDLAFVCKLLLESRGHVVEAVTSGERALARLPKFAPGVLVVDEYLGDGMSGMDLARRVRQKLAPTLPIVMIGGERESQTLALEAGIDAFVAKPFISSELMAAIDSLLAGEAHPAA
jgi:DNA-binding response OmpR family regulator